MTNDQNRQHHASVRQDVVADKTVWSASSSHRIGVLDTMTDDDDDIDRTRSHIEQLQIAGIQCLARSLFACPTSTPLKLTLH